MKINRAADRFHILESHANSWSAITEITDSRLQENAFYICDIGNIIQKYNQWRALLPRVQPYYAVKCNNTNTVLETLNLLGTNFICSSKSEIEKVFDVGIDPASLLFSSPSLTANNIRHANISGISTITFEKETDLDKIKNYNPNADLLLKIRLNQKTLFCCDYMSGVRTLLEKTSALSLHVVGISFEFAVNFCSPSTYKKAISFAKEIFDMAQIFGLELYILDIGDGLIDNCIPVEKQADAINSALGLYFPDSSVRVIAAPSSYFVNSAFTLACCIHSVRDVSQTDPIITRKMYYINDGVYGSFSSVLYNGKVIAPLALHERPGVKYYASSVFGPTCDSLDRVAEDVLLPEMQAGDWLIFENMGAHTTSATCSMNGFPIPQTYVVVKKEIWALIKELGFNNDDINLTTDGERFRDNYYINENFIIDTNIFPIKITTSDSDSDSMLEFVSYIQN